MEVKPIKRLEDVLTLQDMKFFLLYELQFHIEFVLCFDDPPNMAATLTITHHCGFNGTFKFPCGQLFKKAEDECLRSLMSLMRTYTYSPLLVDTLIAEKKLAGYLCLFINTLPSQLVRNNSSVLATWFELFMEALQLETRFIVTKKTVLTYTLLFKKSNQKKKKFGSISIRGRFKQSDALQLLMKTLVIELYQVFTSTRAPGKKFLQYGVQNHYLLAKKIWLLWEAHIGHLNDIFSWNKNDHNITNKLQTKFNIQFNMESQPTVINDVELVVMALSFGKSEFSESLKSEPMTSEEDAIADIIKTLFRLLQCPLPLYSKEASLAITLTKFLNNHVSVEEKEDNMAHFEYGESNTSAINQVSGKRRRKTNKALHLKNEDSYTSPVNQVSGKRSFINYSSSPMEKNVGLLTHFPRNKPLSSSCFGNVEQNVSRLSHFLRIKPSFCFGNVIPLYLHVLRLYHCKTMFSPCYVGILTREKLPLEAFEPFYWNDPPETDDAVISIEPPHLAWSKMDKQLSVRVRSHADIVHLYAIKYVTLTRDQFRNCEKLHNSIFRSINAAVSNDYITTQDDTERGYLVVPVNPNRQFSDVPEYVPPADISIDYVSMDYIEASNFTRICETPQDMINDFFESFGTFAVASNSDGQKCHDMIISGLAQAKNLRGCLVYRPPCFSRAYVVEGVEEYAGNITLIASETIQSKAPMTNLFARTSTILSKRSHRLPLQQCKLIPYYSMSALLLLPSALQHLEWVSNFVEISHLIGAYVDDVRLSLSSSLYHPNWPNMDSSMYQSLGKHLMKFLITEYVYSKYPGFNEQLLTETLDRFYDIEFFAYRAMRGVLSLHKRILLERTPENFLSPHPSVSEGVHIPVDIVVNALFSLICSKYIRDNINGALCLCKDLDLLPSDCVSITLARYETVSTFNELSSDVQKAVLAAEKCLGYTFLNKTLLTKCLPFAGNEDTASFQRLEFLGDGVLGMVIAETIFWMLDGRSTTNVNRISDFLVNNFILFLIAVKAGLNCCHLPLGKSLFGGSDATNIENMILTAYGPVGTPFSCSPFVTKGRFSDIPSRHKKVADLVEAMLGAVYLDGGINAARRCVGRLFSNLIRMAISEVG